MTWSLFALSRNQCKYNTAIRSIHPGINRSDRTGPNQPKFRCRDPWVRLSLTAGFILNPQIPLQAILQHLFIQSCIEANFLQRPSVRASPRSILLGGKTGRYYMKHKILDRSVKEAGSRARKLKSMFLVGIIGVQSYLLNVYGLLGKSDQ